ncbi:hypothetical protein B6N60_01791 [Richelia sinica FACHB-800]|uniref:MEKHLA domain-containing protein n=1 Tax=Richelia sinica FACHB-800 TaxID=1357546 RepID=A0A975T7W8_9NOST|nr:MEKHLA domain-containing protein [Richelia sinica]MBD2666109.1 MEKHLA domain-containing protein [Richelia sinica FACHB-800]QXE23102.1 hypothetical protein B6N60_01791 [Richelia sinica FACHB-800]
MNSIVEFPWQQAAIIIHSQLIIKSFQRWLGRSLLDVDGSPVDIAKALFEAPFVLAAHGIEADPIFNYGNRKALEQWQMSWEEFTRTPSRKSAEAVEQTERNRLLAETTTQGFSYFSGVRITSTGQRFRIEDGIVWNLLDEENQYCGQAAVYSKCQFI